MNFLRTLVLRRVTKFIAVPMNQLTYECTHQPNTTFCSFALYYFTTISEINNVDIGFNFAKERIPEIEKEMGCYIIKYKNFRDVIEVFRVQYTLVHCCELNNIYKTFNAFTEFIKENSDLVAKGEMVDEKQVIFDKLSELTKENEQLKKIKEETKDYEECKNYKIMFQGKLGMVNDLTKIRVREEEKTKLIEQLRQEIRELLKLLSELNERKPHVVVDCSKEEEFKLKVQHLTEKIKHKEEEISLLKNALETATNCSRITMPSTIGSTIGGGGAGSNVGGGESTVTMKNYDLDDKIYKGIPVREIYFNFLKATNQQIDKCLTHLFTLTDNDLFNELKEKGEVEKKKEIINLFRTDPDIFRIKREILNRHT